jgi:AcrR family transcriptional regulator
MEHVVPPGEAEEPAVWGVTNVDTVNNQNFGVSSSQCQHGFVTTPNLAKREPYHHGSLREALIEAAIVLAREGGPDAVVLREVARRVGVSPNAAYRHFKDLPDLMDAVCDASLGLLAQSMESELAAPSDASDPAADALSYLLAAGRGYVHFALAEPGLFAAAFARSKTEIGDFGAQSEGGTTAAGFLQRALDGLVDAGLMAPEDREGAIVYAWAAVHGLANLLLGPLGAVPAEAHEPIIEMSLDLVCRGLLKR